MPPRSNTELLGRVISDTVKNMVASVVKSTLTHNKIPPFNHIYEKETQLRREGYLWVAGVDEAGRGACAGPLVVASCILHEDASLHLPGLNDSKKVTAKNREWLETRIMEHSYGYHVTVISPNEVDTVGVHKANLEGMRRVVSALQPTPNYVLLDGFSVSGIAVPSERVIGGDSRVACIAAASILAKVARDRMMVNMDRDHPGYGFATHKGYCTAAHKRALTDLGPCAEHRFSYAPVAAAAPMVFAPAHD